jgi:small ligand-binding sensory domain FIST
LGSITGMVGMGISTDRGEMFDRPGLGILALQLPPDAFGSFCIPGHNPPQVPEQLPWPAGDGGGLVVLHTDARLGHSLLEPTRVADTFFVGGLTAARNSSLQFHDTGSEDGGATGIWLGEAVAVSTAITQGCMPVGTEHLVTETRGNVVLKLDGEPALRVLREEVGAANWPQALRHLSIGVPLPNRDTDDFVVRPWAGVDERQEAFTLGDDLAVGSTIFLVRRDRKAAEEDLERTLRRLVARRNETPRAGLYFSCMARGPFLFDAPGVEVAAIQKHLGVFPLAGVSCDGEINHDQLYTHTGVLVLFY